MHAQSYLTQCLSFSLLTLPGESLLFVSSPLHYRCVNWWQNWVWNDGMRRLCWFWLAVPWFVPTLWILWYVVLWSCLSHRILALLARAPCGVPLLFHSSIRLFYLLPIFCLFDLSHVRLHRFCLCMLFLSQISCLLLRLESLHHLPWVRLVIWFWRIRHRNEDCTCLTQVIR